jgi:hypothetical protein
MRKFWIEKLISQQIFFLPILVGVLVFIFKDTIFAAKTVSPDAYFILPYLESLPNLGKYFADQMNLVTFDLQPIRDLSLWIDLWVYQKTGLNIFICHNLILFFLTLLIWKKIIQEENNNSSSPLILLSLLLMAAHPVYAHSISYSMARKHLLSFFFISLSTFCFLRSIKKNELAWKDIFLITLSYCLSILSQPISLLFPFWTIIYTGLHRIKITKSHAFLLLSLGLIFVLGVAVNFYYYENSSIMESIFGTKTKEAFNLELKTYSFFSYFYNAFYPFNLSFYSSLQFKRPFFGLVFFLFFSIGYLKIIKDYKKYLIWISFCILPLVIMTTSPLQIYFTYLVIPLSGIFVLLSDFLKKLKAPLGIMGFMFLILYMTSFSQNESSSWTNSKAWGEMNMTRDPHCNSVTKFSRELLSQGEMPSKEILDFLKTNNCQRFSTSYNKIELIVFESQLLFYNKEISLETKTSALKTLGEVNFYPLLVSASLFIQESKFTEAQAAIAETLTFLGPAVLGEMYDKIFDDYLIPYCQRISHEECLKRFSSLVVKKDTPYF